MGASPRRVCVAGAALSLLGTVAVLIAVFAVARSTSLDIPTAGEFAAACRQVLPDGVTAGSLAVLVLAVIAAMVAFRGVAAVTHQVHGHRRFMSALTLRDRRRIAGVDVTVVAGARPQAFCAGYLFPAVYVSEGVLRLADDEVAAVVTHEEHHRRRRDPLRILLARVLSAALFFVPVLRPLERRYEALAELAADDAAALKPQGRRALASALLAFEASGSAVVGIAAERVDHLLGVRPRWELPLSLLLGSLATLAGLMAAAVLTTQAMAGAEISPPMLVAQGCMALMALTPAVLLGAGVLVSRRLLRRRQA